MDLPIAGGKGSCFLEGMGCPGCRRRKALARRWRRTAASSARTRSACGPGTDASSSTPSSSAACPSVRSPGPARDKSLSFKEPTTLIETLVAGLASTDLWKVFQTCGTIDNVHFDRFNQSYAARRACVEFEVSCRIWVIPTDSGVALHVMSYPSRTWRLRALALLELL